MTCLSSTRSFQVIQTPFRLRTTFPVCSRILTSSLTACLQNLTIVTTRVVLREEHSSTQGLIPMIALIAGRDRISVGWKASWMAGSIFRLAAAKHLSRCERFPTQEIQKAEAWSHSFWNRDSEGAVSSVDSATGDSLPITCSIFQAN